MSATRTKKHNGHNHLADRLRAMSRNLWWTWNPEAQRIFFRLAPQLWRDSNHSAVAVMREISDQELTARLHDPDFARIVRAALTDFDTYMDAEGTWASHHAAALKNPVAYFSAEFGIHESLPIYSGGLGILSGDHIKSASDLGIPFIGITLFYREGYFQQRIGADGWQQEQYAPNHVDELPLDLVMTAEGGRLLNSVQIGHSTVFFQTWQIRVGRATLYLLDTNLPENDMHFQGLTSHVYGGNIDTRIGQEIVLGIGGVRLLDSLGVTPSVFHMNEGHSAFLVLELLQRTMKDGNSRPAAEAQVRRRCIFTTHTPVPAGHDRFSRELMEHTFGASWAATGMSIDDLMSYGRIHAGDSAELFTMTVLALRMSRHANGVSELHGRVSREMWKELYPGTPVDKVPIGHVTNGVHTPAWASTHAHDFWNKRLGTDWTEKLMERRFWKKMQDQELATDQELWGLRYTLRRDLVEFARRRLRTQYQRIGGDGAAAFAKVLSPDALTIGFARRFATYKRAPLIFQNFDRILPLLTDPKRPVQLIFAGKAHPRDNDGKRFIQRIIEYGRHPQLFGKVVFLENYDISVARHLVSGCDVWLNNPRRPLEASGTSGQKVCITGGLNVSIMDGWWREGYDGTNGWAIGEDSHDPDVERQDAIDAENLLTVLGTQVIPEFFDRDDQGIPRAWIRRIRNAMETLIPGYSTDRMVAEYVQNYYLG
ncbi:MAG: alpha-glucan family phosphorylase [Bacteroidota bacterium]